MQVVPSVTAIVSYLEQLSPQDLNTVYRRAAALRAITRSPHDIQDRDWLFDGFVRATRSRGYPVNMATVQNATWYRAYRDAAPEVLSTLEDAAPGLDLSQKQALGLILGRVYGNYLQDVLNLPPVLRILCLNLNELGGAIDRAFPGYLEARILHILVRHPHPSAA
jgi:hypothetical protein